MAFNLRLCSFPRVERPEEPFQQPPSVLLAHLRQLLLPPRQSHLRTKTCRIYTLLASASSKAPGPSTSADQPWLVAVNQQRMLTLSTDVAIVGAGPGGLTAAHALRAAAPHLKARGGCAFWSHMPRAVAVEVFKYTLLLPS
jgi:hypothetical protein